MLAGVFLEAWQSAFCTRYQMARCCPAIQVDRRIIYLPANSYTDASIAEMIATSEGTSRGRRQQIRRLLEGLLSTEALAVEYSLTLGTLRYCRAFACLSSLRPTESHSS